MSKILFFAARNMKKYFRDTGVLIFSLLSVFIVSGLYLFFLAQMQIDDVQASIGVVKDIENMINTWVVGGLVCIPAVSVPLIILCFKVDDVVDKTQDDLFVTPTNRTHIMLGYVVAACVIGFIMTAISLILGEVFIVAKGGQLLSAISILKIIGILSLLIISFTGFEFFIICFLKSNSTITVVNSLLNILLGFFLGLYVPIGMLSDKVALIIKACPLIQVASLTRQIIMKDYILSVFKGVPSSIVDDIRQDFGIDIIIGNTTLSAPLILSALIIFGLIFYIASIFVLKYRKEK